MFQDVIYASFWRQRKICTPDPWFCPPARSELRHIWQMSQGRWSAYPWTSLRNAGTGAHVSMLAEWSARQVPNTRLERPRGGQGTPRSRITAECITLHLRQTKSSLFSCGNKGIRVQVQRFYLFRWASDHTFPTNQFRPDCACQSSFEHNHLSGVQILNCPQNGIKPHGYVGKSFVMGLRREHRSAQMQFTPAIGVCLAIPIFTSSSHDLCSTALVVINSNSNYVSIWESDPVVMPVRIYSNQQRLLTWYMQTQALQMLRRWRLHWRFQPWGSGASVCGNVLEDDGSGSER